MNKLRDIIMATDFNRLAKRFLLVAVCVVLVGAAVSGFFLREQIGELAALSDVYKRQLCPSIMFSTAKATGLNWENNIEKVNKKQTKTFIRCDMCSLIFLLRLLNY